MREQPLQDVRLERVVVVNEPHPLRARVERVSDNIVAATDPVGAERPPDLRVDRRLEAGEARGEEREPGDVVRSDSDDAAHWAAWNTRLIEPMLSQKSP